LPRKKFFNALNMDSEYVYAQGAADNSVQSQDDDRSESGEDDEFYNGDSGEEVAGLPGFNYGGYGRCYRYIF
jgi:hypothetical protein